MRSRRAVSCPPPLPEPVVSASTELSQLSDLVSRHFGRNQFLTDCPHCGWPVLISVRDVWTKGFLPFKGPACKNFPPVELQTGSQGSTSAGSCYLFNKMLFLHFLFHFPSSILMYCSFHVCEPAAVTCCCVETPGDPLESSAL